MDWKLLSTIVALFLLNPAFSSDICTWNGGIGDWNDASNWDCGSIPDAGDTVILNSGTINLDTDREIAFLQLSGGLIIGADTLTITDSIRWASGSLSGLILNVESTTGFWIGTNGSKIANLAAKILIHGTADHEASTISLGNGTVLKVYPGAQYTLSGGTVSGSSTDSLINNGTFNIACNPTFSNIWFNVVNNATMNKSGPSGVLNFACRFVQNGTFQLGSCSQVKFYNGIITNNGAVDFDTAYVLFEQSGLIDTFANLTGGKRYTFKGHISTVNGQFPPNSQFQFANGYLNWNIDYTTSDTIWHTLGSLQGTGKLTTTGEYYWPNGTIQNQVECGVGGTMHLTTGAAKAVEGPGRIDLKGDLYLSDGTFYLTTSDTISIHSTGHFHYNGGLVNGWNDRVMVNNGEISVGFGATFGSGSFILINNGTITRTSGTGLLNFDCQIINNGTLDNGSGDQPIQLKIATLANGSSNYFGNSIVRFEGWLLLDTFANISGGRRYVFSGYTTMTLHGTLPDNKQLLFEANTTQLNYDYATNDTVWINGNTTIISGSGSLTINGYCNWTSGKMEIPFICSSSSELILDGAPHMHKEFSGYGSLELFGDLSLESGTLSITTLDTIRINDSGEFFYNGGLINGWNNRVLINNGSVNISFDAAIYSTGFKVINNGSFTKTGGPGELLLDCHLINNGDLTINSGHLLRLANFKLNNSSNLTLNTATVKFELYGGIIDTTASISGGSKFIFNATSTTINAPLPPNKQLEFRSGTTNLNISYGSTDSVWLINGYVDGEGDLAIIGFGEWQLGRIRIPLTVSASGAMYLTGNHHRLFDYDGIATIHGDFILQDGILGLDVNDTFHIEETGRFLYQGGELRGGSLETLHNKGRFEVSHPGVINETQLEFVNDGEFVSDSTGGFIDVNAHFINNETVLGNDSIDFKSLLNYGEFSPGHSIGTLHIRPGLDLSDGELTIELKSFNGPGIGHDLLTVDGAVTLGGELNVDLIDGFTPDSGYCFTILESNVPIADSFDITNLPGPSPQWKVLYDTTQVVIQYFHFECPPHDTLASDADLCYTTITDYSLDLVTMQSCEDLWVENDKNQSGSLFGYTFDAGLDTITWEVNDGHGDSLTCTTTLLVEDRQPPMLTGCPASTSVGTNHDNSVDYNCSTSYSWTHPMLQDNCALGEGQTVLAYSLSGATNAAPTTVVDYDGTTLESAVFNKGVTTVTYTAKDSSGNVVSNTCSFTLTVTDTELPVISCPADLTLTIDSDKCDTSHIYEMSANDNCASYILTMSDGNGSGHPFQQGEWTESYLVTDDAGNTNSCSFTITVMTTPDVIYDTLCVGDSIFLADDWQYTSGLYLDTFLNHGGCDSIVHTYLSTTTECYWPDSIVYVDSAATGENTGVDWANAYVDLQLALDVSRRYLNITEVWTARGTYFPTTGSNRQASFVLADSISLLAGFTGIETDKSQRNPTHNPVTLSGDILVSGVATDNVYHIVSCPDSVLAAVMDGFRVEHGNANGDLPTDQAGTGLLNNGRVEIIDCHFADLLSTQQGSAIINSGASAQVILDSSTFTGIGDVIIYNHNGGAIVIRGTTTIQ